MPKSPLTEAATIIQKLLDSIPALDCSDFHHPKKDQHNWDKPCPLVARHEALRAQAAKFITEHGSK